jgi:hypothetical protein
VRQHHARSVAMRQAAGASEHVEKHALRTDALDLG